MLALNEIFSGLTFFNFMDRFLNEERTEEICAQLGLTGQKPTENYQPLCPLCDAKLRYEPKKSTVLGWVYRCTSSTCRKTFSPSKNTWFQGSHLGLLNVIKVTYAFVEQLPFSLAERHLGMSINTIVDWYRYSREVCDVTLQNSADQIGGPYLHVQLDEANLARRKQAKHVPNDIKRSYVFSGKCIETGEMFLVRVSDLDKNTLWSIIRQRVASGSVIYTDGTPVYDDIDGETGQRFGLDFWGHEVVIPKEGAPVSLDEKNINSPLDRVSTTLVDSMWRNLKPSIADNDNAQSVDLYISRFCYFVTFLKKLTPGERLFQFLMDVRQVYPGSFPRAN